MALRVVRHVDQRPANRRRQPLAATPRKVSKSAVQHANAVCRIADDASTRQQRGQRLFPPCSPFSAVSCSVVS